MIEIRLGDRKWDAPANWEEVSVRRYIDVSLAAMLAPAGKMPAPVLNNLTAIASGVPLDVVRQMPANKVLELAALVSFMWTTNPPKHTAPAICLEGDAIPDGEWQVETGELLTIRDGEVVDAAKYPAKVVAVTRGFGCMRISNKEGATHVVGAGPDGRLTIGGGVYVLPPDFEAITAGHFADIESLGARLGSAPEEERGRVVLKAIPEILAAVYLRPGEDYLTSPAAPRIAAFERAPAGQVMGAVDFFLHRADVSANVGQFSLERRMQVMEAQNRLSMWSLYILAKRSGGGGLRAAWLGAFLKCAGYWPFPRSSSSVRWRWKKPRTTINAN